MALLGVPSLPLQGECLRIYRKLQKMELWVLLVLAVITPTLAQLEGSGAGLEEGSGSGVEGSGAEVVI